MNQILRLKDNIVHFLSPPSKRRRTLPATPAARDAEHHYLTPQSEIVDNKGRIAALSRLSQKYFSPSDAKLSKKRPREDDEFDGTPLTPGGVSPDDSVSQIGAQEVSQTSASSNDEDVQEEEEAEEEEEEEEEVSGDTKVQEYLERQAELEVRLGNIEKARTAEDVWHPDALYLFERIHMRSFEELMPTDWMIDFPALPVDLFTARPEKQIINFNSLTSYAGVRALQSLLTLGERVRSVLQQGGRTERCMTREVKAYIKWSERDGGYYNRQFLPVLAVSTARPGQSNSRILKNITTQLRFLAEKHRQYLAGPLTGEEGEIPSYKRPPPLLYGIIIAQTFAIFVTLDSSKSNAEIKHISHVDFKQTEQGVWNGFAVAHVVICARNYLMSIKDEFEVEEEETDPDL